MTYIQIKNQAISLRKKGYSYSLIAERLGVPKSTLSSWLSTIPYVPNKEVIKRIGNASARAGESKSRQKKLTFEQAKLIATKDIGTLNKRDLMLIGLGLYIGEGQKNETVGIINSDPRVIKMSMKWLMLVFGVCIENFTLAIHLYPDNNSEACLKYWSNITGIPPSQFGKTQIDDRKGKSSSKRGKLVYGTAHLRVKARGNKNFGVLLSRRIHAMMDLVLTPNKKV